MQGIISFDGPSQKRRKTLQACRRCKDSKKRCEVIPDHQSCKRCEHDVVTCSLQIAPAPRGIDRVQQQQQQNPPLNVSPVLLDASQQRDFPPHQMPYLDLVNAVNTPTLVSPSATAATTGPLEHPGPGRKGEHRYATMLSLMDKENSNDMSSGAAGGKATKLISGTNPLSALLGRDLKHKIVTNSCSFRTPDPMVAEARVARVSRRGSSVQDHNWEQSYRNLGIREARIQYLIALGCFQLPPPQECGQLLSIYFAHIHPFLPVLDRKEFLSRYYGSGEPPSLVLLHAVFLAACRYVPVAQQPEDAMSETRQRCDRLHEKLRALIETEVANDRVVVVQASLLASLHWEGREGLNSAIDNLSLGIRICQELGYHRKQSDLPATQRNNSDNIVSERRLWWCAYALDRLSAAQEGTPFLINEMDCDVDELTETDLVDEDELTRQTTLISVSLARIIEDTVRNLYAPGESHITLFTPRALRQRQALSLRLDHLAARVREHILLPAQSGGGSSRGSSQGTPLDTVAICGAFLLTHLDAVRILVHRPFLLYEEPAASGLYPSRSACRGYALDIVSRLEGLLINDWLRYSWPFTVYAVVNCLLMFWYDVSAPPSAGPSGTLSEACQRYASVVNLLRAMGTTWWAAAAKHKLAQALAHAAGALRTQGRLTEAVTGITPSTAGEPPCAVPLTPSSGNQSDFNSGTGDWLDNALFTESDPSSFWDSIGLDFNFDVAGHIYSIGCLDETEL